MVPERIDLPSHALYPESKVTSKSVMGAGRFTDVYQGRMQIEATKKERLVVTKCIKNDDLLSRIFGNIDEVSIKSVKEAFHESLDIVHNSRHPHIE